MVNYFQPMILVGQLIHKMANFCPQIDLDNSSTLQAMIDKFIQRSKLSIPKVFQCPKMTKDFIRILEVDKSHWMKRVDHLEGMEQFWHKMPMANLCGAMMGLGREREPN